MASESKLRPHYQKFMCSSRIKLGLYSFLSFRTKHTALHSSESCVDWLSKHIGVVVGWEL